MSDNATAASATAAVAAAAPAPAASESLLDLGHSVLSPQQEMIVAALRARVDALPPDAALSPNALREYRTYPRVFLVRHLISRKWVVEDAFQMLLFASTWRKQAGIDEMPLFPPLMPVRGFDVERLIQQRGKGVRPPPSEDPLAEAFLYTRCAVSNGYHKFDKDGRVVYIDRLGHLDPKLLVERLRHLAAPGESLTAHDPPALAVRMRTYSNEVGAELVRYQNEENAKAGRSANVSVTVITDCEGLDTSFLYGPALDILKAQGEFDRVRMSEGIHRVLMVNCSSAVKVLWAVVRPFVDERTRTKFSFSAPGEETLKALKEHINPTELPKWLGGLCECEGGCLPDYTAAGCKNNSNAPAAAAAAAGSASAFAGAAGEIDEPRSGKTIEITVKAGTAETRRLRTPKTPTTKTVEWSLVVPEYDVNYSIHFEPAAEESVNSTSTSGGSPPGEGDAAKRTRVIKEVEKLGASTAKKTGNEATASNHVFRGQLELGPDDDGSLIFTFDNSYSWMRGKTVTFRSRLAASPAPGAAAAGAASAAAADNKAGEQQS
jgi:hypothetical protein